MTYPSSKRIYELERYAVAAGHLNWAMRLLMDYGAPAEAVTLAGAAEEVCGTPLADEATSRLMTRKLAEMSGLPEKFVRDDKLNRLRNWLKHHKEPRVLHAPAEMEAVSMIVRGIVNFVGATGAMPSEGARFRDWLMARRIDLFTFQEDL